MGYNICIIVDEVVALSGDIQSTLHHIGWGAMRMLKWHAMLSLLAFKCISLLLYFSNEVLLPEAVINVRPNRFTYQSFNMDNTCHKQI